MRKDGKKKLKCLVDHCRVKLSTSCDFYNFDSSKYFRNFDYWEIGG